MKLTATARRAIPTREFAEPGKRKYPIQDASHARNALARVSQFGSSSEKSQVRAAVHRKYPNMGKKDSDGDFDGGMHSRGHHSNQGKYKGPSHAEFHSLDHGRGSGHDGDHMIGRNGKAGKVGYKGC